jgi:hypothetical protein
VVVSKGHLHLIKPKAKSNRCHYQSMTWHCVWSVPIAMSLLVDGSAGQSVGTPNSEPGWYRSIPTTTFESRSTRSVSITRANVATTNWLAPF